MRPKYKFFIVLCSFALCATGVNAVSIPLDSLTKVLDQAIEHSYEYEQEKLQRINAIRSKNHSVNLSDSLLGNYIRINPADNLSNFL
jgi:hypothetical protein